MSRAQTNIAVLAEKPSVARDIPRVLGAGSKGHGFLHGNGYVVTWAIGRLAALAQPLEINPGWKHWRRDTLPMPPGRWPLVVYERTKHRFDIVKKILSSERISEVVCATAAGRTRRGGAAASIGCVSALFLPYPGLFPLCMAAGAL